VSYEIELTGRAEKEILKLDAAMFERIKAAITGLGENPRPLGVRKLMDLLVDTVLETDSSVEIRPYTSRDLKEARPTNFLGHILAEGKVVYKDGEFFL
jgi:hypothetical protein